MLMAFGRITNSWSRVQTSTSFSWLGEMHYGINLLLAGAGAGLWMPEDSLWPFSVQVDDVETPAIKQKTHWKQDLQWSTCDFEGSWVHLVTVFLGVWRRRKKRLLIFKMRLWKTWLETLLMSLSQGLFFFLSLLLKCLPKISWLPNYKKTIVLCECEEDLDFFFS